jgi:single-stranded-DNA-specific exonuclease
MGGHEVTQRSIELANTINKANSIHIVTHVDADGITAGAIALQTLRRLGKNASIECVKQLDPTIMERLANENHELLWFTDLGSSFATQYPTLPKIITDHHACPPDSNLPFHLNPHLFGLDGSYEISGAGTTFLVSTAISSQNSDLATLAVIGAVGDLQDRRFCCLKGENRPIIEQAVATDSLHVQQDLRFFGKETRPLSKLLQFANDPFIPGLTGREEACSTFLEDLQIRLTDGDEPRRWIHLEAWEKQKIVSALTQMLLAKGFGHRIALRLIGESYLLAREKTGTELHDAKEFATLLNSTARYGQEEVGLQVCLGDRGEWLGKALNLLRGHRLNLVEGLQYAREEKIQKRRFVQFFNAGDGIRDTIIGIVTNMLLNSEDVDASLPLLGFACTENGDIKVSARATQVLVDRGLDLSAVLKMAAEKVNGVGGGHNIAAGATIPKGKEEEFLSYVERQISVQLKA